MTEENSNSKTEEETQRKTILYSLTREALTPEDIRNIKNALEEIGYFMEISEDGENIMIQKEKNSGNSYSLKEVLSE